MSAPLPQDTPAAAFEAAFERLPLIAILRGIEPKNAAGVGETLADAGFTLIEAPLNSPEPFESIRIMSARLAGRALVGAGTVLRADDVARITASGGRFVVMPHGEARVIEAAHAARLPVCAGVATPSEAFAALDRGVAALKAFPGEALPPAVIKAWRAVLPRSTKLLAVGGVGPQNMEAWTDAGANGFGVGSALFTPDLDLSAIAARAAAFVAAWRRIEDQARSIRQK